MAAVSTTRHTASQVGATIGAVHTHSKIGSPYPKITGNISSPHAIR